MAKFHGKNTRVYLDGYDISGYTNSIDIQQEADTVDVAAFSSQSKEYVVGLLDSMIEHAGFFDDTDTIGAHALLSQRIGSVSNIMALIGTAAGGHSFAGSSVLESMYSLQSGITAAVTWRSKLMNFGTQGVDPTITISARRTHNLGTYAAIDLGAPSNNGGRAYLQNFGSFGHGTPVNAVGSVWLIGGTDAALTTPVVLASFGSVGVTPSALGVPVSGTVYRYIAASAGAGTPQFALTFDQQ